MIINEDILRVIYENIDEYTNFAEIYFIAQEIYNKKIAESSTINIDNVNTYDMGQWIKFEGKKSNEKEYIENSKRLSSLVKDTPWCTKALASTQLSQGDFYVFVDNENKPHIAVKLNGNEIDEVRGIKNDNAQELEDEYRKVAISFLENNKEIKYGKEWLEKEEWNNRLISYINKIDNNQITQEDIPKIIDDIFNKKDYKAHSGQNTNLKTLEEKLSKIKDKIAIYYNCKEEELYFGDINFSKTNYTKVPYKIIFGDAKFIGSKITNLGNLTTIVGNADFRNTNITDFGNLTSIGGDAYFGYSSISSLGNLKSIGGNAYFRNSKITNLGNLTTIGGSAIFRVSNITDLGNLTSIGEYVDFGKSEITNLGNLISIGEYVDFGKSEITNLGNLISIGGDTYFGGSKITNLGNLTSIGGYVDFAFSSITDLGNLTSIGGNANFENSKITDLKNIEYIGGKITGDEKLKEKYRQIVEQQKQNSTRRR